MYVKALIQKAFMKQFDKNTIHPSLEKVIYDSDRQCSIDIIFSILTFFE